MIRFIVIMYFYIHIHAILYRFLVLFLCEQKCEYTIPCSFVPTQNILKTNGTFSPHQMKWIKNWNMWLHGKILRTTALWKPYSIWDLNRTHGEYLNYCMPKTGIEPVTFRSSVWRSPNWANSTYIKHIQYVIIFRAFHTCLYALHLGMSLVI